MGNFHLRNVRQKYFESHSRDYPQIAGSRSTKLKVERIHLYRSAQYVTQLSIILALVYSIPYILAYNSYGLDLTSLVKNAPAINNFLDHQKFANGIAQQLSKDRKNFKTIPISLLFSSTMGIFVNFCVLYFMDSIFNFKFFTTHFEERTDPLSTIFPRIFECKFNYFDSHGSSDNSRFVCLLPLNEVYE